MQRTVFPFVAVVAAIAPWPARVAAQAEVAWPRRLELAAPAGTAFLVRCRHQAFDVPGLLDLANRLVARGSALDVLAESGDIGRVRSFLQLMRGVERNAFVAALRALLYGEAALAALDTGGRPVAVLLGRLDSEADAAAAARSIGRTLRWTAGTKGPFLWAAPTPEAAGAAAASVAQACSSEGPSALGRRIARELATEAPVAAWLDLRRSPFADRLRAGLTAPAPDFGAALLRAGLGGAIASGSCLVWDLRWDGNGLTLGVQSPGALARASVATRAVLALDAPRCNWPTGDGVLGGLVLHRSLPAFLAHRDELAGPRGKRGAEEFLAGLELLFRGLDAEHDLLAELKPGFVLFARRAAEGGDTNEPYRLPEGALGFRHAGPHLARSLEAAAQVAFVVGNNDRREQGKQPYRVQVTAESGLRQVVGRLVPPQGERPLPIEAAIVPTLARQPVEAGDSLAALGTSPAASVGVLAALGTPRSDAVRGELDRLEIDLAAVAGALLDARPLVAGQLLLDRGLEGEAADRFLGAVIELFGLAGRLRATTAVLGDDLRLELRWQPDLTRLREQAAGRQEVPR